MRITFVTSEKLPVPPVRGGAVETWIWEIGRRLGNHKAQSLCIHDDLLDQFKNDSSLDIRTYRHTLLARLMLCSYKLPFKNDHSFSYYYPYSRWCSKTAFKFSSDIIHNHSRPQFIPVLRKFNPKAKIILHIHNVSNIDFNGKLWPKTLMDQIDLIATCSNYLKEEALTRYPYLKDKVQTLYNGVDTHHFNATRFSNEEVKLLSTKHGLTADDKIIVFSGRLTEYKGVHILIEAFKQLQRTLPEAKLLILGGMTYSSNLETPYIRKLKEMIKGLENKIIFTGYVDHKNIPAYLNLADVIVVPSIWEEPFGVVVIEGMAMGKAVVAFRRGGIKEIISTEKNGILLNDADPTALATALQRLLTNKQLTQQLEANARKHVEKNFSWERILEETLLTYQRLTATGR